MWSLFFYVTYGQPLSGFNVWKMKLVLKEDLNLVERFVPKESSHLQTFMMDVYLSITMEDNK
jgi:hypothetical protein